jgi:hypothetical protein
MEALTAGLGRAVRFSVVAPNGTIVRQNGEDVIVQITEEPWWAALMRRASGMGEKEWRS